jgi:hypothetical protein
MLLFAGGFEAQYVPNAAKRPYFAWTALFYLYKDRS